MGTVSALIIICCLFISAALTVVIILLTIPAQNPSHETNDPEEAVISEANIRYRTTATNYSSIPSYKKPRNSSAIISAKTTAVFITTTTVSILTTANTIATTTDAIALHTTTAFINQVPPNRTPASSIVPIMEGRKLYHEKSPHKSTTVNLSTNITVINWKKNELTNRRSVIDSRHHATPPDQRTRRNFQQNLVTAILHHRHHHVEQLPLNDDNLAKFGNEKEQRIEMKFSHEVTFRTDVKVVGLTLQHELLYVATNDGEIAMINPETGVKIKTVTVNGKINRMTVTKNGDIIILNGTSLLAFRNGKEYLARTLPSFAKSLSVATNELGQEVILVLGRSNDALFVFANNLKPIDEIYYENTAKETCNFAIFHHKYYYISCQSAILQLSQGGEIINRIGDSNGTFSLGITIDNQERIIAIIRGHPVLRVFLPDGKLRHSLSAEVTDGDKSAIWSEILYENGRLHVVDYLTSKLKTFHYPNDSTTNDA